MQCSSWGKFWDVNAGKAITSYSIPALGITGIIKSSQISLLAPTLTTLTPQIASFTTTGAQVTVNGVTQASGVTSNSYASSIIYTVTAVDGSTQNYTVSLTAPKIYGGNTLRIWLRADSLALTDGAQIATWPDDSATGNSPTQATPANRPIYRTNIVNGNPVGRFTSASTTSMFNTLTSVSSTGSSSFFIVMSIASNAVTGNFYTVGAGGAEFFISATPNTRLVLNKNAGGNNYTSTADIGLNKFTAIATVQVGTATSITEFWNGDVKGSGVPSQTYAPGGNNTISNGSFNGDIAEVLYFDTALSATETNKIFCYLNTKYDLASVANVCQN